MEWTHNLRISYFWEVAECLKIIVTLLFIINNNNNIIIVKLIKLIKMIRNYDNNINNDNNNNNSNFVDKQLYIFILIYLSDSIEG